MRRRSVSQPNLNRTPGIPGSSKYILGRRRSNRHKKLPSTGTPGKERHLYHSDDKQTQVLLQWQEKLVSPQERPCPSPIKKPDPLFHMEHNIISPKCSSTSNTLLYKSKSVGNLYSGSSKSNLSDLECRPNRPDAFYHMDRAEATPARSPRLRGAKSLFQVTPNASGRGSPVKWSKTSTLFHCKCLWVLVVRNHKEFCIKTNIFCSMHDFGL